MRPFRIRKSKPASITPRRKSMPGKWDDSYSKDPIPLYNALNDPNCLSVKHSLKDNIEKQYSFRTFTSDKSVRKAKKDRIFARDEDIKKAKLELINAWYMHRIPVYYQKLFEDAVFPLPK